MRTQIILFSMLSLFFTLVPTKTRAGQFTKNGKIVCTESSFDERTNQAKEIGKLTVTLNNEGKASLVQLSRANVAALPAINKTFSFKSSTIKHELVVPDQETIGITGVAKVEVISVLEAGSTSLSLKINDTVVGGHPRSSYSYDQGKISVSTLDETTRVYCEGEIRIPWQAPTQNARN